MNLANVVRRHAELQGDKIAVRFGDEATSYAELWSRIERVAAWLHEAGVGRSSGAEEQNRDGQSDQRKTARELPHNVR